MNNSILHFAILLTQQLATFSTKRAQGYSGHLEDCSIATGTSAVLSGRLDQARVGVDQRHLARREGSLEANLAVDLAIWQRLKYVKVVLMDCL